MSVLEQVTNLEQLEAVDEISEKEFLERFGWANQPCILKGVAKTSKAYENWTFDYFEKEFNERQGIAYRTGDRDDYWQTTVGDYVRYLQTTQEANPYYLLDWFLEKHCPEVINDFHLPNFFCSWLNKLPNRLRPKFLSFYIGPKQSASPLHVDILSTSAWNTVYVGKKIWVFYPPSEKHNLYVGKVTPFSPDYEKHPNYRQAKGYYVIQEPGDTVFTPSGWWHAVYNAENCISLTDNFINESNYRYAIRRLFPALWHFLKRTWNRRKQIIN